jgi:DNA-binding YbaB/EbfC family protein
MFDMNNEMFKKMQEAVELSKNKLESLSVVGEAAGGLVRIELNGNRKLKSLEINAPLKDIEKEDLEDFISIALDRALEQANEINEKEMSNSATSFLPKF